MLAFPARNAHARAYAREGADRGMLAFPARNAHARAYAREGRWGG
jgi:hypothetical protein